MGTITCVVGRKEARIERGGVEGEDLEISI